MKKIISVSAFTLATGMMCTPIFADPITHTVDYICPAPSVLANFGSYIAGYGTEILSRSTTSIVYFKSTQLDYGVPSSLSNYENYSTNYDGPSGTVSCTYASSNPQETNFSISYAITNGKGGRILSKGVDTIRVLFLVGYH